MGVPTCCYSLIIISVLLLSIRNTEGATISITVTGNGNLWSDAALWPNRKFPGSNDDVILTVGPRAANQITLDKSSTTVKSLVIIGTAATSSRTRGLQEDAVNMCKMSLSLSKSLTVTQSVKVSNAAISLNGFTLTVTASTGIVNITADAFLEGDGQITSPNTFIAGLVNPNGVLIFKGKLYVQPDADLSFVQRSSTELDHITVQGSFIGSAFYINYFYPANYDASADQAVLDVTGTTTVGNYTFRRREGVVPDFCRISRGTTILDPSGCSSTAGTPSKGFTLLLKVCASAPAPCQCTHGGTCTDTTGYKCSCPSPYWVGDLCKQPKCPDNCNGHGTCIVPTTSGDPYCACSSGWSGASCQIGTCRNDCSGQGSCNILSTTPQCQCNPSYSGDDCSIVSKVCTSSCNYGTCNTATGTCSCNTGYTGNACNVVIPRNGPPAPAWRRGV